MVKQMPSYSLLYVSDLAILGGSCVGSRSDRTEFKVRHLLLVIAVATCARRV